MEYKARLRLFAGPNGSGKSTGGHNVPTDKIESRYYRTLELLPQLIAITHRAYIFDNSSNQIELIAEIENATEFKLKSNTIPQWLSKALHI